MAELDKSFAANPRFHEDSSRASGYSRLTRASSFIAGVLHFRYQAVEQQYSVCREVRSQDSHLSSVWYSNVAGASGAYLAPHRDPLALRHHDGHCEKLRSEGSEFVY